MNWQERYRHGGRRVAGAFAAVQAVHETCVAAAVMAAALLALHKADDHAFHLLRCVAMSVTLNAGYARTARQTARGAPLVL